MSHAVSTHARTHTVTELVGNADLLEYIFFGFGFLVRSLDLKGICLQEVANTGNPVYNGRSS